MVCVSSGRHRWVIYTTEMNGKKTLWEVDGSMVPAEWYGRQCCGIIKETMIMQVKTSPVKLVHLPLAPQASLAALHDRRPPHHTPARAQEVPGRDPPVQRYQHPAAVRPLLDHPQEDPRVGSAQSRSSVSSCCLFVNYGFLHPVNKISIQTFMMEVLV